jgi:orotate phosphoribosyltransferase-like protein
VSSVYQLIDDDVTTTTTTTTTTITTITTTTKPLLFVPSLENFTGTREVIQIPDEILLLLFPQKNDQSD